jgi:hypothetical protein
MPANGKALNEKVRNGNSWVWPSHVETPALSRTSHQATTSTTQVTTISPSKHHILPPRSPLKTPQNPTNNQTPLPAKKIPHDFP